MIYRRKTYRVRPEMVGPFTQFFEEYLLPNQMKHGADLVGRWVSDNRDEIMALWEYPSRAEYERIEEQVRKDPLHAAAQVRRSQLGELFLESREDFFQPTGRYGHPRHILAVAGYITNAAGEVLLVKTNWRSDTWELPGGQVEEGEEPTHALHREILEETGVDARIEGLSGVYYNTQRGICTLIFRGVAVGGSLATSSETTEVKFFRLDASSAGELITRPSYRVRVLDAMKGRTVPFEAFRVRPYELVRRHE